MTRVGLLVEGSLDETVGRVVAEHCGLVVDVVYGKRGSGYIQKNIRGFNRGAAGLPLLIIADSLDISNECPPAIVSALLPYPHPNTRFRLAVREIESWLIADRVNLAKFLGIRRQDIPGSPESLRDPKGEIIRLARRSRIRSVRELLVPAVGTGGSVGIGYTSEMQRFAMNIWDIESSMAASESLRKCVAAASTLY